MADLPAKEALSGLRLGESNGSSTSGLPANGGQSGAGADNSSAFNAVLTEGGAPSNGALAKNAPALSGLEAAIRPDLLNRTDAALRSEGAVRLNPTGIADSSGLIARGADAPDIGTFDLPVLQLGSSDRTVGLLQRALALLGFLAPRSETLFGAETDQAVRAFQDGQGLARDGVVGNRETWPAINYALISRHEGVTRLAEALGSAQSLAEAKAIELKQLNAVLAEIGERTAPPVKPDASGIASDRSTSGDVSYTARGGETLADVARTFGLPVGALIATNPELAKPYLILQGQLLTIPNPVKERSYRRPPRQLHSADPEGYLASANMNPDFVAVVNGMIAQLRSEGFDVRVIAGFRSFAEQQQRFEQGRRTPGKVLTDDEGGQSWHNYGLAVDIVLNDDDGRPAWPEDSAMFWQRLGDVALAHGAVWGGLFGYPAHVEYHPQFERNEAGSLIEDFESHGLESIWERIALDLPPDE